MAATATRRVSDPELNRVESQDRAAHTWYRFVLSYPPHLVREYLERFSIDQHQTVLDPFCGTGTTVVECKKQGIPSIGLEANGLPHFAGTVKVDWTPDPDELLEHASKIARETSRQLEEEGVPDAPFFGTIADTSPDLVRLPDEKLDLLIKDSISARPLHKTLRLLDSISRLHHPRFAGRERLALAAAAVSRISNLRFGPEVGVGPHKPDAPVVEPWLSGVGDMVQDLRVLQLLDGAAPARVHRADARALDKILAPNSVDAVITSPPYPNEKDYTRSTRLESVLLGFINSKAELRALKRELVRSNTRGVYKHDDDDHWVRGNEKVQRIAQEIEHRRIALNKTSGFERMYARVTKLYFGGMARHFAQLRSVLRPGAHLAYVVGDQASYLRVMIRTGQLLAEIAESLGYEVIGIDLFRTRLATATKEQLREEVVVLRWPGGAL
jgi:DNA modification methylase